MFINLQSGRRVEVPDSPQPDEALTFMPLTTADVRDMVSRIIDHEADLKMLKAQVADRSEELLQLVSTRPTGVAAIKALRDRVEKFAADGGSAVLVTNLLVALNAALGEDK